MRKCRVYLARAMSGRPYSEVVSDAAYDRAVLRAAGFEVLCPVEGEGVKDQPGILQSTKTQMDDYWQRDRAMIAAADVMFNMSPHTNSIGVQREHGLMQYGLKRPVVSVFPVGKMPTPGAICYYEDFMVTDSVIYAAECMRRWWKIKDATEKANGTAKGFSPAAQAAGNKNGSSANEAAKPVARHPRRNKKNGNGYCGCELCVRRDIFREGD